MINRRTMIAGTVAASLLPGGNGFSQAFARSHAAGRHPGASFAAFLQGVRTEAVSMGVSGSVLAAALSLRQPNRLVLDRDRNQPEFTLSWAAYRLRVLNDKRIGDARSAYRAKVDFLTTLWQRYQVDPRIVVAIWGLESDFGNRKGTFEVVDALATLAFAGHRQAFFRSELLDALQILQQNSIEPEQMFGSYAGAMGQPQFMPSSYLRYAVDFAGDGRRDIWTSDVDSLASIANYLGRNGWAAGSPWGQPVSLLQPLDPGLTGLQSSRTLDEWTRLGVRRADGGRFSRGDISGALLLPAGPGGDSFMVYNNFNVIRRYNASDFYALAVGLLGSATA